MLCFRILEINRTKFNFSKLKIDSMWNQNNKNREEKYHEQF